MKLTSNGDRLPSRWETFVLRKLERLRIRLGSTVVVRDRDYQSVFACTTYRDAFRPLSLWLKEPGTMAWLDDGLRSGDRFLDIGANVGIYTIAAAHRVGPEGRVYAVEPHKANLVTLLRNISLNGFGNVVEVIPDAVSDHCGRVRFNYARLDSGSSMSQLGHTRHPETGGDFSPVASELVTATTVDRLVGDGHIEPPSLVKIDVDGNELLVLAGMKELLTGGDRPRSVQVEMNIGEQEPVEAFFGECGFRLHERNHTMRGSRKLAAGVPLADVTHNAVFVPDER